MSKERLPTFRAMYGKDTEFDCEVICLIRV